MTSSAVVRHGHQGVVQGPAPTRTELAVIQNHKSPIIQHLVKHQDAVATMLPEGVRFERVVFEVMAALAKDQQQKKPALVNCTPDSVFIAVVKIQAWGLEIGRTAHLVPFGSQCEALIDFKGDIELAKRSGAIYDAEAHCVYANEVAQGQFRYELGMNPVLEHIPIIDEKSRGALVGVYAILEIRPGRKRPHYLSLQEVEKIRQDRSKQWKDGPMPAWYMVKTAFHQALKTIPKNPALARVLQQLERGTLALEGEGEMMRALGGEVDAPTLVRDDDGTPLPVDAATGELVGADVTPPAAAPERGTLEWARALPLPWKNSDQYGKPIGDFSRAHIESIAAWCEKKANEAAEQGREPTAPNVDLYDATQLLLEDLSSEDADIPDLSPPAASAQVEAAIETAPVASPPGSKNVRMPKGGNIADALPLDDLREKPNRNALAEP